MKEIFKQARDKMAKTVEAFRAELNKVRTGRAHPGILDEVKVSAYDTKMPLSHLATITAPQSDLLVVQPFDKNLLGEIEKAIVKSDLGLNPVNDGNVLRIPIPKLTEERRKELVKHVRKIAEDYRKAIRNIRRDFNEELKKKQKEGGVSEDDVHRGMKEIQNITDEFLGKVEEILQVKEKEIMEI